jgi:hypothetical protein
MFFCAGQRTHKLNVSESVDVVPIFYVAYLLPEDAALLFFDSYHRRAQPPKIFSQSHVDLCIIK